MTDARLDRAWEIWAAENLLRGKRPSAIVARLVSEGVPEAQATLLIDALARSAVYEAATRVARDARRWTAIAALHERLTRDAAHPTQVLRTSGVDAAHFYDLFYATGTPVVLDALVADAFDMRQWSPGGLAARFGDVEVEVTVDREDEADYARTFRRRSRTMSLTALVEHIEASANAPRNDVYLVAENRFFERPPLDALLGEIRFPPGWLDEERLRADGASLWLGGAGTRTPLHHDHANLLACQLYGRKRWRLIAPTERALLAKVERPFSTLDASELGDVVVKDVIVHAGEALFVPAGWWHQVESLVPSTTISITAFARDNEFALLDLTRVERESHEDME